MCRAGGLNLRYEFLDIRINLDHGRLVFNGPQKYNLSNIMVPMAARD